MFQAHQCFPMFQKQLSNQFFSMEVAPHIFCWFVYYTYVSTLNSISYVKISTVNVFCSSGAWSLTILLQKDSAGSVLLICRILT